MANERKPSDREKPDDEPTDDWDDLLDDPFEDNDDPFEVNIQPEPAPELPAAKPTTRPMRTTKQVPAEEEPEEPEPAPQRPVRKEVAAAAEEPVSEPKRPRRRIASESAPAKEEEESRPEDLDGAELTKDGLIRVKEGAGPKKPGKDVPAEEGPEPTPQRRARKEVAAEAEEPAAEPERPRKGKAPESAPAEEEEQFRPEDLEGAELTKDGLIRVKEGAGPKKPDKDDKQKEPWLKSLGVVDYIGLAASLAILVGLAGTLLTWMYGEDWGEGLDRPDVVPELPVAGNLFKVTSIESYWRRRIDTDRAHDSEIIIPEITIEVEAVGSDGFLSVLFLDPSGTMSADAGNLKLAGGQLSVGENEGRQDGPNRFTFTSTRGFTFEPEFRSYISLEQKKRWAIEVVEKTEYGGKVEDSKRLAYFEIAKDARTREDPSATPAAE